MIALLARPIEEAMEDPYTNVIFKYFDIATEVEVKSVCSVGPDGKASIYKTKEDGAYFHDENGYVETYEYPGLIRVEFFEEKRAV